MTMHLLIVEDDVGFVDEIKQVIEDLQVDVNCFFAKSRDEAYSAIDEKHLDYVILDLKIPTKNEALDEEPEHGLSVFTRSRSALPGVPILVLTGSSAENFIPIMLNEQQQVDIWSQGQTFGTVDFLKKIDFEKLPEKIQVVYQAIDSLSEVEVDRGTVALSLAEQRILRIFAKKFGGVFCKIIQLGGGLSGAKVLRVKVTDTSGALIHNAVAKIGSMAEIQDEARRFDIHVSRLRPEATPRKLATIEFGGGALAGVFYGLADGYDKSVLDVLQDAPQFSDKVVEAIKNTTRQWGEGVPSTRRNISEIRRRLLSDRTYEKLKGGYDLSFLRRMENREYQVRWPCVHGDLHVYNSLISDFDSAVLIDYGDVEYGPASLDPLTLELSLIFHPETILDASWPTIRQARLWGDLDAYLEDCPYEVYVRSCRRWAEEVSAGKREILVVAYSYLLRQLKYEDTNKELALALLDGVMKSFEKT
ncbi:response regulator [Vreelandella aquamarina]|mgnify:FL=1|uniref:response regulator n=1 Tax=Vreelandella aquamarina TaxID=77097 RepID=UPI001D170F20|nr:response regulator [Halomonas axialensis]MCC4289619.1 response regulator [Halomonas axialensis]|tara:strand:- start:346 stop:1770 length:1425 start_codon:yes stop_codon:yes gene_type:complete